MRQMATVISAKAARDADLRARQHAEARRVAEEGALSRDSRAAYLLSLVEEGTAPRVLALRGLSKPAMRALMHGIARAVGSAASVQELDAVGCGLCDDDCARALRDLLAAPTQLRVLRLDSNHLTSVSAREIAAGLRLNTTLQQISLEDNPLCKPGTFAAGEAEPEENENFRSDNALFLQFVHRVNLATGETPAVDPSDEEDLPPVATNLVSGLNFIVERLSGIIPYSSTLDGLAPVVKSLEDATRSMIGVCALLAAVARHPTLKAVSLFGCSLGTAGVRLAAEAARLNARLEVLDVSPFDGASLSQVAAVAAALGAHAATRLAAEGATAAGEAAARKEAANIQAEEAAAAAALRDPNAEWTAAESQYRSMMNLEEDSMREIKEQRAIVARKYEEKERSDRLKAEEVAKVRVEG